MEVLNFFEGPLFQNKELEAVLKTLVSVSCFYAFFIPWRSKISWDGLVLWRFVIFSVGKLVHVAVLLRFGASSPFCCH